MKCEHGDTLVLKVMVEFSTGRVEDSGTGVSVESPNGVMSEPLVIHDPHIHTPGHTIEIDDDSPRNGQESIYFSLLDMMFSDVFLNRRHPHLNDDPRFRVVNHARRVSIMTFVWKRKKSGLLVLLRP